ncbi:hypothetical protein H0X48_00360 [Candidatus Dependentiae bacterium]|nr:hypothetical protein [Candidatus Dependentiae bacterium]
MLDRLSKNPLVLGLFFLLVSLTFGALFMLPALALQWLKTMYTTQEPNGWQTIIFLVLFISNLLVSGFIIGYFYSKYHEEALSQLQKRVIPLSFILYSLLIGETINFLQGQESQIGKFFHKIKAQQGGIDSLMEIFLSLVLITIGIAFTVALSKWALGKGSKTALKV